MSIWVAQKKGIWREEKFHGCYRDASCCEPISINFPGTGYLQNHAKAWMIKIEL
jgi:hypothetical protein